MKNSGAWFTTRLGDLIEAKYGKALPQTKRRGGNVPVYGSNGVVGWHDASISSGPTIVIGRKGSSGAVNFSQAPCWPIDTTYYIDKPGPFQIEFLDFLLRSLGLTELDRSTAIPGLNREQLYDIKVPVPPTLDQAALVAILREAGARRGSAANHLEVSRNAIKRFRRAVLVAACSGRLTADFHQDEDITEGTMPLDWHKSTIEEVCERVSVGHVGPTSMFYTCSEKGVVFIRSQNVRPGRLVLDDVKFVTGAFHGRLSKSQLRGGDVLIVRVGANRGDCCMVPIDYSGKLNCANVIFARPKVIDPAFLTIFFQGRGRELMLRKTTGSAQGVINTKAVAGIEIAVPPVVEQRQIVRRTRRLLEMADRTEIRLSVAARQIERYSRALLTRAFRGE